VTAKPMLTEQPRIFRSETSTSQSPNLTPCARVKVEIADATAEAETIHLADKRQPVEVQPMAPAKSPSRNQTRFGMEWLFFGGKGCFRKILPRLCAVEAV